MRLRRPSYSRGCLREPLSCKLSHSCELCIDHPHAVVSSGFVPCPQPSLAISDDVHPCRSGQSAPPMVLLVRSELTSFDSEYVFRTAAVGG